MTLGQEIETYQEDRTDILHHTEVLSEPFLKQYKGRNPKWGFDGLGYIVYKRTYARTKNDGTTEEWWETVARCIRGAQKIGAEYTIEEAERLYDHIFNLRCSFSGRGLWQLGTKTVDLVGMDSLLNCWVTKVSEIDDFAFIFMESMLGGGVGAVVTREFTQELPRVKKNVTVRLKDTNDADYIVPDSKEGWMELWRKTLEAYLVTGKSFTFSTVCIRPEGQPIKTFGGIAPGPRPLREGTIELARILESRAGKKLRTPDVADIICCGGEVVRSGGVRRTALILQGDVDDFSFMNLKRWDLGVIPPYRGNSNNSIMTKHFDHIPEKFWDGYNGNGEPCGAINLRNCRRYGRLGETSFEDFDLYDESIIGVNPCAEANTADKECCNLAELFVNNIESKEQMLDCATLLYKTQKAICAGNYLHDATTSIVHKNMRIGLGVTGVCQRLDIIEKWCDYTYRGLRKFDQQYSKFNNWNTSIRLTTVKPSGTLSLLAGATPGGHPGYSKYFLRTVRFQYSDPLIPLLKKCGYKMEPEKRLDGTENHKIVVVYFPCRFEDHALVSEDCGAIRQLEILKTMQTCWADQAVSVTVYYKKEELPAIKQWMKDNYDDSVKTVSFCLHSGHGFEQAVYNPIPKEEYEKVIESIKPFDSLSEITNSVTEVIFDECSGGVCPIK
jgi:ribonucleoside-triphosphate reductase